MENCPNCGVKINPKAFFSPTYLIPQGDTDVINYYADYKKEAYCGECGLKPFKAALALLENEIKEVKEKQKEALSNILCLNLQSPLGWDYEPISLITAQSTIGTGLLTEITSDFDDFFGLESGVINNKILRGENNCLNSLRGKCITLGGNAIIGVDIDYSEIGGLKGMIMVCMTGTAIKVKNTTVFSDKTNESIALAYKYFQKLKELNVLNQNANKTVSQT